MLRKFVCTTCPNSLPRWFQKGSTCSGSSKIQRGAGQGLRGKASQAVGRALFSGQSWPLSAILSSASDLSLLTEQFSSINRLSTCCHAVAKCYANALLATKDVIKVPLFAVALGSRAARLT